METMKNLASREAIRAIIKGNLNKLIKSKNFTQSELGDIFGVYARSTISNYLNDEHDSIPDITSLYRLKEYFGIPLDVLFSPNFDPTSSFEIDGTNISEYDKFIGVYNLYYLTTSKISTIPNKYSEETQLNYGVLAIVKDMSENKLRESYRAYACFTLKEEENAVELKNAAEKALEEHDYVAVSNLFTKRERYYEGDFELIQKGHHYALSMTGYSRANNEERRTVNDKILLMGFNPDNTDSIPYIGGAMLSSSLSRGDKKSPCSQIIMISRPALSNESVMIKKILSELRQTTTQSTATDSIMNRLDELSKNETYTEADKMDLLRLFIERKFKEESEKTSSQLLYLFSEQDKIIYHYLKQFI